MLNALQTGVITIVFGVAQPFSLYNNGTYTGPCAKTPNHAMNVIGYTAQHWIVRNSWGTEWGENGFAKIPRGQNKCRIEDYVVSVVV
jgi:C1A family cysteine protease